MKPIHCIVLVAAAAALAGCAQTAGDGRSTGVVGTAASSNIRMQTAYGDPSERLRDVSIAFRAATSDTVNFEFNRADLDAEARRTLDQQIAWLKANEGVRMAVVGHTDLVGGEAFNDRLGLRRARAVVDYMTRQGISRSRLDAVESRGEREPVVATEERERRNRRTVTQVIGFEAGFIGTGLDGVYAQRIYDNYQQGAQGSAVPTAAGVVLGTTADVAGE